jgi:hypothetical protein
MAKSITSASLPAGSSIKSCIPFSPHVCGGLVLYFSFTLLSIVLGLFLRHYIAAFSYFSIDISTAELSSSPDATERSRISVRCSAC